MQKENELRRAVARLQRGRRERFPKDLRSKLIAYIHGRRDAGATLEQIGEEIGVNCKTVANWVSRARKRSSFCRVEVAQEQGVAGALTVRGPCGVRVEGMAITDLVDLLRRLA